MKIQGQLEWTDYLEAQLLHLLPTRWGKILLFLFLAGWGLGLLISLLLATGGNFELLVLMLPATAGVIGAGLYRFVILPQQVKRVFTQQKELHAPFEMEVTETSLNVTNAFGQSQRPWNHFIKWKENRHLLLLYHSDALFTILPKRLFTDPHWLAFIRIQLETHHVPLASSTRLRMVVVVLVVLLIICVLLFQFRVPTP